MWHTWNTHERTHKHLYIYTYTYIHVCTHTHTHTYIYVCIYICIYIHECTNIYIGTSYCISAPEHPLSVKRNCWINALPNVWVQSKCCPAHTQGKKGGGRKWNYSKCGLYAFLNDVLFVCVQCMSCSFRSNKNNLQTQRWANKLHIRMEMGRSRKSWEYCKNSWLSTRRNLRVAPDKNRYWE